MSERHCNLRRNRPRLPFSTTSVKSNKNSQSNNRDIPMIVLNGKPIDIDSWEEDNVRSSTLPSKENDNKKYKSSGNHDQKKVGKHIRYQ